MLLELGPAPRPTLNTLLTVLCTSLRLNYSTLPLMERLTVCLCMSWRCTVCVQFMHEWICLESKNNISFLCMYVNATFPYLCARKWRMEAAGVTEWACDVWVVAQFMCMWWNVHTHVCQVCLSRMWALCVFLGFSLSGSASFCSSPKINSAPSIPFLAPISKHTQTQ